MNVYRDICNQLVMPAVAKEKPDVIGLSIGTQMQLLAGLTFCKMIKETFPHIHVVVGGNVITRLQEELPNQERFFTEIFDSAILYEGEHALLWLIEALNGERPIASVPNLMYRDESGVQQNPEVYTEKTTSLPLPDFDGLPLDRYFVPELIIPYLATRGCYWGRCTFCDHGQGYFDQYRGVPAHQVVEQIKALRDKYHCRHFLFSDESYPPALFKKVSQLLVDQNVGIKWTTLIRFEETLQDQEIWDLAAKAGCCTLYYGMESANERVLNLMDKHAKKSVIQNNLHQAAKAGIWNHVMAFYGFPGETRDEALETRQFVIDNQPVIHSVELFYFVAYRHTPMVRNPDKFGITIHKQEDYDLPLDYYYTLNDPSTLSCLDAMQLCEEFYKNDFHPWAVRVNAREHVFLYISKFGTNKLPQIYAQQTQAVGSPEGVSGLVTWPVAVSEGEDGKEGMSRVVSRTGSDEAVYEGSLIARFLVGNEHGREQGVGCFDEFGHLFGLLVGLHVFLGVVGQIRVAGRVPGVQQHSSGPIEGFGGDGEGESQHLQCMVHVFLGHIIHLASVTKPDVILSNDADTVCRFFSRLRSSRTKTIVRSCARKWTRARFRSASGAIAR